jgi:D-alanyl-D-alanine carboxypeptidase
MLRKRVSVFACLIAGLFALPNFSAHAADSPLVSRAFSQLATTPTLADPSVIVVDEKTGEIEL